MSRTRPIPLPTPGGTKKRVNRENLSSFIGALLDGATLREIVETTGMNYETIRPTVKVMHEAGVVYVSAWKQDPMGRWSIAVYQLGRHADTKKPRPRSEVERTRKYQTKKAGPELTPLGRVARIENTLLDHTLRSWNGTHR